jgi:hypothetical protein
VCPITMIYAIRFVPPHFSLVCEIYQIANLLSTSFFAILRSLKEIRAATV